MLGSVHDALTAFTTAWYDGKRAIENSAAFSNDAIHVLVGGTAPLVVAFLSRRTLASWLPWLAVFILISVNETVDLVHEHWPTRAMQYAQGAKDILLTMALPTALLLAARLVPQILAPGAKRRRS